MLCGMFQIWSITMFTMFFGYGRCADLMSQYKMRWSLWDEVATIVTWPPLQH